MLWKDTFNSQYSDIRRGGGLILIRLLISFSKTQLSMYDFAFRFKNVQSRVDQTMPKAMVAATHWFFLFNYCMKLICDAYIYTLITRDVRWLSEAMSQSADEEFFLVDYVHQFHVDSSILQWWILQIYIGISLICRCIIIQNNCEIKQYLAFSVSKLKSILRKLFKVLLV